MMNKLRKVTAGLSMMLLAVTLWSTSGRSQDERSQRADGSSMLAAGRSQQAPSTRTDEMSAEEKLVRDAYARLMRYQSAAVDEVSAHTDKSGAPNDYLTFELRNIHSGSTGEIYERPLAEVVTSGSNGALRLKPVYLSRKAGPTHAYYEADWISSAVSGQPDGLVKDVPGIAGFDRYIAYDVTVQFHGKQSRYRAMVLYQAEKQPSARPTRVEILDAVTVDMNTVYRDESPRVRSPWEKYVKTSLYQAVARTIKETKDSGRPLFPVNAPIGYLPGDDVSPNDQDARTMALNAACRDLIILRDGIDITGTTQSAVVGQQINLSLETNPEGEQPSNIQWTIGGNRIANYVVNGTGPTGSSTASVTALADLSSPSFSYYWITAGQGLEVSVTATVFGTQLTKSASFNITAPNPAQPTVTLPTNGQLHINNVGDCSGGTPGPAMVFGSISGPNPGTCTYSGQAGIRFAPPSATSPPGNFFFVQLITLEHVTYTGSNGSTNCTATVSPGLDRDYPYQRVTGQSVSDAPFAPLPSTYLTVSRDFGATMYLMWQSNTSGSIPVPMGSVAWGFSASTSQPQANSGNWSAPNGSGSAQPFVAASGPSSFPIWSALNSTTCH